MPEKTKNAHRIDWLLPFYTAVGALILSLLILIYGGSVLDRLYLLLSVPIISILLMLFLIFAVVRKNWRPAVAIFVVCVVYVAVSWITFRNSFDLRTTARWLLSSRDYKARLSAGPDSADGLLKHMEWDGWGFAGIDTVAYLVFDPNDLLSTAANSHAPGKYSGIPCQVQRVRRMESHYYVVLFYTDQEWSTTWGPCK
jgi:hypothetical protein